MKAAKKLSHRLRIQEIGVLDHQGMKVQAEDTLADFDAALHRPVNIHREWYY